MKHCYKFSNTHFILVVLLHVTQAFFPVEARSQSRLEGVVKEENGKPLAFATVLLLNAQDSTLLKGMVSQEDGKFHLDEVKAGKYLVQANMVGYEKTHTLPFILTANQSVFTLQPLVLSEAVTELGEVIVAAEKPFFEQKIDRLVVNVQSSITASSGTALEVLERSPSVMVDHYNSTLRMNGKNGVQVMINGKLSRMPMQTLYQMLGSMQAINIEQIELITTPPANLDAEGDAGYINIVLRKNEGDGLNGSFFVNAEMRRRFNSALGGNINIRKDKFSLYANYSFTYNRNLAYVSIDREINHPDYLYNLNSTAERKGGADLHNFRLGIDYNLSSKTVIGILSTIYDRYWSQETDMHADFRTDPGADSLMNGFRTDVNKDDQFMLNFNFQHNFTEYQQLNIDLDYFYYYAHQPQSYDFQYFREGLLSSENEIRINKSTPMDIWVAKADYNLQPNERLHIETGLKATYSAFSNDILTETRRQEIWQADPMFSESASMDEVIGAAYASISYKMNKTSDLKAGVRYEYTHTDLISESAEPIKRRYGSFFPTLFYSKKLSEHNSWQLSYNRRITRPAFSELAPFVIFLDPVTFVTGNSTLFPAFTHTVKTDFSHKGIIISLQASHTNNAIYRFQPQADTATNVTTYASLNIDREDGFVLSLTLPLTIAPWWEVQNNLQGMIQRVQTRLEGGQYKFSQYSFRFNTSNTFKLPHQFSVELAGFFNSPSISGINRVKALGAVNIGIRKEFGNNGGTLNLSFSDIFRNNIIIWESSLPEQYLSEKATIDFDTRSIKLTYTKKFGSQKVKSARKRATGSAEEQKRL